MSHGGYQYVVRLHKKPRKSVIHPLHSTIPVVAANLESQRVTVQYDITNGMKRVRRENWADQSDREGRYSPQWRGFTFFRVRGAAPTSVMPTMEETSDFWNDGAAGEGDGAVGLDCWTRTSEEGHVRQTSSTAAASSTPSHDGRTPPIPYTAKVPLMYEPPVVNNMDHSAGFPVAEVDSDLEVEIGASGVLGKPKYQDALRPSSNREVFQMKLIEASAVPSDVSSLAGYPPTAVGHAATGVPSVEMETVVETVGPASTMPLPSRGPVIQERRRYGQPDSIEARGRAATAGTSSRTEPKAISPCTSNWEVIDQDG